MLNPIEKKREREKKKKEYDDHNILKLLYNIVLILISITAYLIIKYLSIKFEWQNFKLDCTKFFFSSVKCEYCRNLTSDSIISHGIINGDHMRWIIQYTKCLIQIIIRCKFTKCTHCSK